MLADTLLARADLPTEVRAALTSAIRRTLSAADLARLDAWMGDGRELHTWLPAITPLAGPVWYEAEVVARQGTVTQLGYLAVPEGAAALAIWWVSHAPALNAVLGPVGPTRCAAEGLTRPGGITAGQWHECRVAASILLRALLLLPP